MPKDFIYETAITIDHEEGVMLVDTTVASVASALRRAGFEETTKETSAPYRRFRGAADQLRFRRPKGQRLSPGRAKQLQAARMASPKAAKSLATSVHSA